MSSSGQAQAVVPEFNSLIGQKGIHIQDHIEDVQAIFYTDRSVEPEQAPTDGFVYPVDSAAEVTVTRLQTSFLVDIWIRDFEGDLVREFNPNDGAVKVPSDEYLLEFASMGMKIYVRIEDSGFRLNPAQDSVDIVFDPDTSIQLGARSLHTQPARTLTTTSDPKDLMHAISLFGNEMKTWSPERTWPSLRGHPPLLEIGTKCRIPDDLTPPDTGITLTIPADHEWVYPAAPLAYWLGATVEPGSPALHVDDKRYPLGIQGGYKADCPEEAFEQHVQDVLQFTFLLDCAVRTEGFYDVELDARRRVEDADLDLDFEALYEASLSTRIQTYLDLDVGLAELEARIGRPGWRLTADVEAGPKHATILPFLARDLAVVRCPSEHRIAESTERNEMVENVFSRSSTPSTRSPMSSPVAGSDVITRSSSSSTTEPATESRERIISLPEADSMSQAWVGDGFAVGAAKASTTSYLQRLENHAQGESGTTIDVVVNDEQMAEEADVSEIYGTRDHLEFNIRVQQDLTASELASVFERDTDFIHYIGHVDEQGFDCSDGYLDARTLEGVGAEMFLLNACASYEQGQALVDKGAIAGVVTLEDVINSMATKIGRTYARLLNFGFPIGSATKLVQETMFSGAHYAVAGDSNAALAQSNMPVPNVAKVELLDGDRFEVTNELFASWNYDIGSMCRPYIEPCDYHYLVPGTTDTWAVEKEELDKFLNLSTFPVIAENNLCWSDEITASTLQQTLQSYSD